MSTAILKKMEKVHDFFRTAYDFERPFLSDSTAIPHFLSSQSRGEAPLAASFRAPAVSGSPENGSVPKSRIASAISFAVNGSFTDAGISDR